MGIRRLFVPAVVLTLVLAAPAAAGEQAVSIVDYDFSPGMVQVQPGDSVTWTFNGGAEHTTTAAPGQSERWDSDILEQGASYSHTFTTPGRYQYVCLPHRSFMRGTIQVGADTVPVSYRGAKTTVHGRRATTRFKLLEPARFTAVLRGPKRAKIEGKRAEPGKGSVAWGKKLKDGRYKGTITFVDDFDKKSVKQVAFKVG